MNLPEKNLYQQIHPLRLATDWITGFAACYFFWQQDAVRALIIAFIPSLIVSLIVIRFADLERLKNSSFGRYFKRTYNKTVDLVRFGGFIIMAVSSWFQDLRFAGVGLFVIIGTWTYGLFRK